MSNSRMPGGNPPSVQVQFGSLYRPDMSALADSLVPFGSWSEERIAAGLPVTVSYPAKISERLEVLQDCVKAGEWPRRVGPEGAESVRDLLQETMPRIEKEIAQGVRIMAAAAIRDDGSRAVAQRDEVLSMFLASKMLATARMLHSHSIQLGDAPLDWGPEFSQMVRTSSDRLICGLSFLAREPRGWAGWTGADLHVKQTRYRVFAPICAGPDDNVRADTLAPMDVRRLIIPQLLGAEFLENRSFLRIRELTFEPWETFAPNLVLRDEIFVDSEACSCHPDAKACIIRIAADRIALRLQQVPLKQRPRRLFELTHLLDSVSFEVAERVRELIPMP